MVFAAPEHLPFLLTKADKVPKLKLVVSLEALDDDQKGVLSAWAKSRNLKFMDIAERECMRALRGHSTDSMIMQSRSSAART